MIKKLLGIDKIEKKLEDYRLMFEGMRAIQFVVLQQLEITPEKLIELIKFNSYNLEDFSKKVVNIILNELENNE